MIVKNIMIFFLFLLPVAFCHDHLDLASAYQFNLTLVPDRYWLYWNFNTTTQNISFAVRVQTTGWIGFGISPNGQMPESDVVIGWIDGSNSYFNDRFALGRYTPPIDPIQNWFLTNAKEENGYTVLEFWRNFTSCDDRDLDILFQTSHVIYSWNDVKPTRNSDGSFSFMRHTSQGSTSVNLLGGLTNPPTIPDTAESFTIGTDQITIPSADTTYWCKAIRLPDDVLQSEKYIVKYSPNITAGNEEYVHHMLVYLCNGLQDSDLGAGGHCFAADGPGAVNANVSACTAGLLIAAWAVGGGDFTYPANVAYPFGGAGNLQYMLIETHYNNPRRVAGVTDSSGIAFTYISTRREHNAGVLFMGHVVEFYMPIPPRATNFTVTGVCSGQCTQAIFPAGGIHIFANMLHTHTAGYGLTLRRFNNATCPGGTTRTQELKPVDRNLQYDFNFQQATYLPEEITVMPGDTLILDCIYRTTNRTTVTLGGESTQEEMCLSFPVYYPRLDDEFCVSAPSFAKLEEFVLNYVPSHLQASFLSLRTSFNRATLSQTLNSLEWTQEQIDAFQRLVYSNGTQTSSCVANGNTYTFTEPPPSVCCAYETANTCTGFEPSPCCDRTCLGSRSVSPTPDPNGASTLYYSLTLVLSVVLVTIIAQF